MLAIGGCVIQEKHVDTYLPYTLMKVLRIRSVVCVSVRILSHNSSSIFLIIELKEKETTRVISLLMSSSYRRHSFHSSCLFLIRLVFDPQSSTAGLESVDSDFFFKLSDRIV